MLKFVGPGLTKETGEWETFQTKVDHGISIQQMYDVYGSTTWNRASLRKMNGEPSDKRTEGMIIEDITDRLGNIISGREISLAERSSSYCDYHLFYDSLERIGRAGIMPPESNRFSVLHAWQLALVGIPVPFQLSIVHRLVILFDLHLLGLAHRAEPDVRMTINLIIAYFKGVLKALAPIGIERYFEAHKHYVIEKDEESGDFILLMKMTHPRYPKQTKEEFKVDAESAENWRDDLNNEEGSDWSSSDEDDLDDSGSESSESDADSGSTRMFRILLIDDGAGDSHRLVNNDASSNGNSISLAIAALASKISQQGVIFYVASDILQLMARFEPSHGSACLTEPDHPNCLVQ